MNQEPAVQQGRKLLEACPLFRTLEPEERGYLTAHAHRQRYSAGAIIFHIGSDGASMMAVLSGIVRISIPSVHGSREIVLGDLSEGEVLGEISLLDGGTRSADALALTNCELVILDRRDVLPFLQRSPQTCLKLLEVLCRRLRRADERMIDILFFDLEVRLAKLLLRQTESVTGPEPGPRTSKLGISQRELGSLVGGRRESVNRCLQGWQRQGLIRLRDGWIVIEAPAKLREIIERF